MSKWHKATIPVKNKTETIPIPIVADALIATRGLGDGRGIPLLIVDTSQRPDIDDMVTAHQQFGSGDVTSGWLAPSRFHKKKLGLYLQFIKPSQCVCILEFEVATHIAIINQIIEAESLYLQPGKIGDRFITTSDNPRILLEIPSKEFRSEWDKIHRKLIFQTFRNQGASRQKAKQATEEFLQEWRKISSLRIGNN